MATVGSQCNECTIVVFRFQSFIVGELRIRFPGSLLRLADSTFRYSVRHPVGKLGPVVGTENIDVPNDNIIGY